LQRGQFLARYFAISSLEIDSVTLFGALFGGGSPMGFLRLFGSFIGDFFGVGGSFLSDGDFALLLNICLDLSVSILC